MTKTAIKTGFIKARIQDYLDRPDTLSAGQRRRIRAAFANNDYDLSVSESEKLLDQMCLDADLKAQFEKFTNHRRCQVSLIRDVLMGIWEKGQLATQPIMVKVAS